MVKQCKEEGCIKIPHYDIIGGKGRFCATHKSHEMINVKHKKCEYEGCNIRATYDISKGTGRYCSSHKTVDMINVVSKHCEYKDCRSLSRVYDIKGGKGRFCVKHKTSDMINVVSKKCEHLDCKLKPNYNIKGGKGRFCLKHKTSEMIDVVSKRCENKDCDSHPAFDIIGGKGRFCLKHKTPDMIDVKSKRCKYTGCNLRPSYNIKGMKVQFCNKHKTDLMIDVKHRTLCKKEECSIRPSFGIKGEKPQFCNKHKTSEMIDVITKHCEYQDCNILNPSFDTIDGKGRFCVKHKLPEMIDVKYKQCQYYGCITGVIYGKPGNKPSHCAKHREKGMIRKPTAKCSIDECKKLAIWGTNWTPKHCESHKTDDDQNLVEQPCSSCGLLYILDKSNKCENCNPESWATALLAKQNALMDYLDAYDLKGSSTDIVVDGGACGKERPDRVYDFGDKIVILECDEHQHKGRACLCEQTRMINIGQIFGGVPVYFIRWNPDDYSPKSDKKKLDIIAKRHKLCADLLNDIKTNKIKLPIALVSAIYLYYDNWSCMADEKWEILSKLESI